MRRSMITTLDADPGTASISISPGRHLRRWIVTLIRGGVLYYEKGR
jgi:hypothetical protein